MRFDDNKHGVLVVMAMAILAVLAASLVGRLRARPLEAPPGGAPAPTQADLANLTVPCWSCQKATSWPIRNRVDLDLIAPLGDGVGNAGEWLATLTDRVVEQANERMIDGPQDLGRILPADDSLLEAAEPWCDQARLELYPEIYQMRGYDTEIPNLLLPLTMAKSWIARGRQAEKPEAALADYRRVVRLGRLLRQEDVTIISDLVGIAAIRIGSEAILAHAVAHDDLETAVVASLVIGELAPQRLLTSERIVRVDIAAYFPELVESESILLTAKNFEALLAMVENEPDRRFRCEAIIDLGFVFHFGEGEQKSRAGEMLAELARSPDDVISALATWALEEKPTREILEQLRDHE